MNPSEGGLKMKRLIILGCALSLGGCVPLLSAMTGTLPASPAPLAQTTIDDKALSAAWKSFDVALDAINLLIDHKVIVAGSPKAKAIADGIDKVTGFLTAAESAAAAGSATDYKVALANAGGAIVELRAALKG
jgi:hypothetical protein